jgi:hypothetical protein
VFAGSESLVDKAGSAHTATVLWDRTRSAEPAAHAERVRKAGREVGHRREELPLVGHLLHGNEMNRFHGYVHSRIGGYKIIEGIGPHGGDWMAKGRGEAKIFDNKKDAIEHARNSEDL